MKHKKAINKISGEPTQLETSKLKYSFATDVTECLRESERLRETDIEPTTIIISGVDKKVDADDALARLKSGQEVYLITKHQTCIGRSNSCDIVISNPTVSRRHAEIICDAGKFILRDLSSTNGVYHNGIRVSEAEIASNSLVALDRFGKIAFRFEIVEQYTVIDSIVPNEHFAKGVSLQHEKRWDSAAKEYLEAIRLGMKSARPYFNLGVISFHQGNVVQAIAYLQKGLSIEPNNVPAHADLGKLYESTGELQQAIEHLQRALKLEPDNETVQRRLARISEAQRIHQEAEEQLGEKTSLVQVDLSVDLMFAAETQRLFQPETPNITGWDIAAHTLPAREVTGDYHDFIPLNAGQLAVAIADVSGKGMAAAILMSGVRSSLRANIKQGFPLAEVMNRVNITVYEDTAPEKFITLFVGVLDVSTKTFTYCNAGHNYPILYRSRSQRLNTLECGGVMTGFLPDVSYQTEEIMLEAGDALLFYTDGITEATDSSKQMFGEDRLQRLFLGNISLQAQRIVDAIYAEVKAFSAGNIQDDATLIVVKAINGFG